MILFTQRGMTLIELIVFIIVGGLFIPLAFVGISTALKDTAAPEAGAKLRFIAETKMEDITRWDYDNVESGTPTQTNYGYVTSDSLGRFSASSFSGYTWRWIYENIAYQEGSDHSTTTILTETTSPLPTWTVSTNYLVGQYIIQNVSSSGYHFYRASFKRWQASTRYDLNVYPNMYAIPLTATTYGYPFQVFQSGTSKSTEPTWPTSLGTEVEDGGVRWKFVKSSLITNWNFWTYYGYWDVINNGYGSGYYVCIREGRSWWQPSGASNNGDTVDDPVSNLRWLFIGSSSPWGASVIYGKWYAVNLPPGGFSISLQSGTSGTSTPAWPSSHGGEVYDGLKWRSVSPLSSLTLTSGTTQPTTWPTTPGGEVVDNHIRWVESRVYKRATVYVRPPNCAADDCTYTVSTIITSRTGP